MQSLKCWPSSLIFILVNLLSNSYHRFTSVANTTFSWFDFASQGCTPLGLSNLNTKASYTKKILNTIANWMHVMNLKWVFNQWFLYCHQTSNSELFVITWINFENSHWNFVKIPIGEKVEKDICHLIDCQIVVAQKFFDYLRWIKPSSIIAKITSHICLSTWFISSGHPLKLCKQVQIIEWWYFNTVWTNFFSPIASKVRMRLVIS